MTERELKELQDLCAPLSAKIQPKRQAYFGDKPYVCPDKLLHIQRNPKQRNWKSWAELEGRG